MTVCKMTEIYRAIKNLVEPIKVMCQLIFYLLQTSLGRNEVNIPSVQLYTEQDVRLSR